jgi:hypothetical protein
MKLFIDRHEIIPPITNIFGPINICMRNSEVIYEVTAESAWPKNPNIRYIINPALVKNFITKFPSVNEAICEERRTVTGDIYLMLLVGDHIVTYSESEENTMILFFPFSLSDAELTAMYQNEAFTAAFRQMVASARANPVYPKGKIVFMPAKSPRSSL